ncbi:MAG TPA: SCO family protein [Gaiellaceae bacterium]|nr:SCO family protein [Gaiellaceae bacterium]
MRSLLNAAVVTIVLLSIAVTLGGCGQPAAPFDGSGSLAPAGARSQEPHFDGVTATGLAAPNFVLHDQHGRLVSLSGERGRYVVITFLYTHCPDVCPLIASALNEALRELGSARRNVRVLAVSVDPKRDTPAAVRRFISAHRLLPQFLYLTGTLEQLEPIWREYHVASTKGEHGVVVGHTAIELLLDPQGKPRLLFDSHITARDLLQGLGTVALADASGCGSC